MRPSELIRSEDVPAVCTLSYDRDSEGTIVGFFAITIDEGEGVDYGHHH
jgi:hypothetical protein